MRLIPKTVAQSIYSDQENNQSPADPALAMEKLKASYVYSIIRSTLRGWETDYHGLLEFAEVKSDSNIELVLRSPLTSEAGLPKLQVGFIFDLDRTFHDHDRKTKFHYLPSLTTTVSDRLLVFFHIKNEFDSHAEVTRAMASIEPKISKYLLKLNGSKSSARLKEKGPAT